MQKGFLAGSWIDGCALSSGYALVVVEDLDLVCYTTTTSSGIPTELWRRTASEPLAFVRCAADTATNEVRAIALGTTTGTARYFTSTSETSKGAAFGDWPVLLQRAGGDWVGYIARTSKLYTRWPFAGADPGTLANPFTLTGTNMGMIQVIGSTVTWRERTPNTATNAGKPRIVSVGGVTYQFPMVVSGVTVGQSLGPPTNSDQVVANHNTNVPATIFALKGDGPHVAALSDATFLIVSKTTAITLPPPRTQQYSSVAFAAMLPPWPAYDAAASQGPDQLRPPWDNSVTAPMLTKSGTVSEPYQKFFETIANREPLNLSSVGVTSGGGSPAPPPPPLVQSADVVVGTDGSGFPNARLPIDTPTIAVDVSVDNEVRWNYVGPTIAGPVGPPGRDGEPGSRGRMGPPGKNGSGVSYVPVTTGAEPIELVSNGAGSLLLIPYTP